MVSNSEFIISLITWNCFLFFALGLNEFLLISDTILPPNEKAIHFTAEHHADGQYSSVDATEFHTVAQENFLSASSSLCSSPAWNSHQSESWLVNNVNYDVSQAHACSTMFQIMHTEVWRDSKWLGIREVSHVREITLFWEGFARR